MAIYHFHVTQVSRGKGQSAIAAAAYRAGERLQDHYYGEYADYTAKGGVVYTEIIAPDYVPESFHDRETLWNAVEKVEKHPKAQLAYIEKTKTEAGTRVLPMSDEVYAAFKRVVQNRKKPKVEEMIDGYTGFLFLDKRGKPMMPYQWEKRFQHVVEKYNRIYRVQLPKITPHVCRHTFCTNAAKRGISVETLKYLM